MWIVENKKTAESLSFLENIKIGNTRKKISIEKILEGVRNESLYSFFIVDIHTPDKMKEKFKDFSLIIKNSLVSLDDIGWYSTWKMWQRSTAFLGKNKSVW